MESPFIYYRQVTGKNFLGRREDCNILGNLLSQGEHAVIYAPPKAGKSSLLQQAMMRIRATGVQFVAGEFNLLNIRNSTDFLTRLGSTVLRSVAVSPDEYAEIARQYFEGTHFVFDRKAYEESDSIISTSWELDQEDVDAMLTFPFRFCRDRHINLILIMDEFQNILFSDDGEKICASLGKAMETWKNDYDGQGRCSFVFCGSMVNAMNEIFRRRPWFYRLVERVELHPIEEKEIIDYIHRGFMLSGKEIDRSLLHGVCALFKCNMWYINHFVAICDHMTRGYIIEPMLMDALKMIISIHEPRFVATMADLTTFQVSLLKAILEGQNKFSSSEVVRNYNLNSSANVKRVKEALMKKELVTFSQKDEAEILDPLFEYWVRKYYFNIG